MARFETGGRERGAALIATLLASALLMIVGSIASQQALVSWLIGHRMRESAEALVAAETGLAMAIADLEREPSFARFDLPPGSPFPFAAAPPNAPLPDSFRVRTELRPRSDTRVDFVAIANGRNRARRMVAVTVERGTAPYVPAALFLGDASASLSVAGDLTIAGAATADGVVPALGAGSLGQAESLRDQLEAAGAALSGGSTGARWSEITGAVARLRSIARVLPDAPVGAVTRGIWASASSVEIAAASGVGVWLVDGDLTVRSNLTFDGLLVVLGDIEIAAGAEVEINGSLAQLPPGRSFQSRGETRIRYSPNALRDVESLDPTLLGRRARLIGWRDDG